ncbi:glycosyl hydrolase [Chitinophaga sp.]|uniref:glycosyl hydrolase n=1 Tax=Chitinophaga sp. TaxID=1869181 RepID=UPI0031D32E3F
MKLKALLAASLLACLAASGQNVHQFQDPSDDYRPWIFWDWINDMVTKKGITSDLEQFKKFGLSGTLVMLVGSETNDRQMWSDHHMPHPIISQTPAFFDAWKFAAEESARVGLTISSQCGPGWCHSGGPWVKPDQAVQHIAYTEIKIAGGDRAVTLRVDDQPVGKAKAFHSAFTIDDLPVQLRIDLDQAVPVDAVYLHPFDNNDKKRFGMPAAFNITVAGKEDFSDSVTYTLRTEDAVPALFLKKNKKKVQHIRITTAGNYSVLREGKTQYLLALEEIVVMSGGRNVARNAAVHTSGSIEAFGYSAAAINDGFGMTLFNRVNDNTYTLLRPGFDYYTSDIAIVAFPDKTQVSPAEVIDLTRKVRQGKITWKAPAGNWVIRRYAMRNALAFNRPPPVGGKGLECDKLDKLAVNAMFDSMVGRFIRESPQLAGNTIRAFEADSWEVGNPEWTAHFREEFIKRRGYDPAPWLITYKSDRVLGNEDLGKRFANDLYLTQTDLFAENFFSNLSGKADSLGMQFMTEPYTAPFDPVRMAGRVQVPMCEFWVSTERMHTARWAASAANTYGRKEVAAEAYTGRWNDGNWKMDPYAIKRVGDLAFCNGVNKMILHGTALQPWGMDHKPGMNMFFWGTMFVPAQTWLQPGRAWTNYLSRCQYMLQQGRNVADVAGLLPTLDWEYTMPMGLHKKYNYDLVSEELLLNKMDVKDGYFTLPSGAKYRVLLLPETKGKMSPEMLRRIGYLLRKGGNIVCRDKPYHAPGLLNYQQNDSLVRQLTDELWGRMDGSTIFENKVGAGRLIWMKEIWKDEFDAERDYFLRTRTKEKEFWEEPAMTTRWSPAFMELLASVTPPDVEVLHASGKAMGWGGFPETAAGIRQGEDAVAWTHRLLGNTDIYFVSSQVATEQQAELMFRVKDKIPVIWDPETGKQYRCKEWAQEGDRIRVKIPFTPFGAVFILFKSAGNLPAGLYGMPEIKNSMPLELAWDVLFPEGYGAPPRARLTAGSWSASKEFGIKYFSGTATYHANINCTKKQLRSGVILSLGTVKNLAEVIINGSVVDTLWKPPYQSDISDFLHPGENSVTLKVTNTWWNRLVGDEQLPPDLAWRENLRYAGNDFKGYELKEFPAWVWSNEARPSGGRVTFTPWRFVEKDSELLPAGLIGPVKLLFYER